MFYQDTIAAITTASKNGSISVIRISGSQSFELVSKIFFQKNGTLIDLSECESHTIQYGFICDEEKKVLDEVLVLLMKAPTGNKGGRTGRVYETCIFKWTN